LRDQRFDTADFISGYLQVLLGLDGGARVFQQLLEKGASCSAISPTAITPS
jgi:hypothetical protein